VARVCTESIRQSDQSCRCHKLQSGRDHLAGTSHASANSSKLPNLRSQATVIPLRANETDGPDPGEPLGRCGVRSTRAMPGVMLSRVPKISMGTCSAGTPQFCNPSRMCEILAELAKVEIMASEKLPAVMVGIPLLDENGALAPHHAPRDPLASPSTFNLRSIRPPRRSFPNRCSNRFAIPRHRVKGPRSMRAVGLFASSSSSTGVEGMSSITEKVNPRFPQGQKV